MIGKIEQLQEGSRESNALVYQTPRKLLHAGMILYIINPESTGYGDVACQAETTQRLYQGQRTPFYTSESLRGEVGVRSVNTEERQPGTY